jgi:hypothetical protein
VGRYTRKRTKKWQTVIPPATADIKKFFTASGVENASNPDATAKLSDQSHSLEEKVEADNSNLVTALEMFLEKLKRAGGTPTDFPPISRMVRSVNKQGYLTDEDIEELKEAINDRCLRTLPYTEQNHRKIHRMRGYLLKRGMNLMAREKDKRLIQWVVVDEPEEEI